VGDEDRGTLPKKGKKNGEKGKKVFEAHRAQTTLVKRGMRGRAGINKAQKGKAAQHRHGGHGQQEGVPPIASRRGSLAQKKPKKNLVELSIRRKRAREGKTREIKQGREKEREQKRCRFD